METRDVKISIIVPVYDVAEYLRRCLDSCVYQTLQEIEIIIVNDCSPDKRDEEIMKEYALRFPTKIRLFWHSANSGLGAVRNTGIRAATGEFVQFVDSDDYIDLTMCEKLYDKAKSENADMVVCDVNLLANGKLDLKWNECRIIDSKNKMDRLLEVNPYCAVRLIIRRELLIDNKLYFPEHIFYEDFLCCLWHIAADKVAYVKEKLYYYIQRTGSICNVTDVRVKYNRIKDIFKCIQFIFGTDFFNSTSTQLKDAVYVYLFNSFLFSVFHFVVINCPERLKEWCGGLRQIRDIYNVTCDNEVFNRNYQALSVKNLLKFIDENVENLNFIENANQYCASFESRKIADRLYDLNKRRFVIWGAGKRGKRLAEYLTEFNIPFEITDKNPDLHGIEIGSAMIKPWEELAEHTDAVIVSTLNIYHSVVTEIDNPKIICLDFEELGGI